jgi:exopolysaccharide biosynthesis protein
VAPGLQQARAEPWPGAVLHLLRLDLREPTLRLELSARDERALAIDAMPGARAALAAVNASFFDRAFNARGWSVSEGRVWPAPLAVAASPLLACDRVQRCAIVFDPPAAPPRTWFTAVAGTPWLLRDGRARDAADDAACPALCAREHPRTVAGLDAAQRHLWLVVAEGRRPGVPGVALAPLAQWLRAAGVHEAVNLDGGGSSALFVGGRSVAERPAHEPQQRPVANALRVVPAGAPGVP